MRHLPHPLALGEGTPQLPHTVPRGSRETPESSMEKEEGTPAGRYLLSMGKYLRDK